MKKKLLFISLLILIFSLTLCVLSACSSDSVDLGGVVFSDTVFTYNGQEQTVEISELPEGVNAAYVGNKAKDAGIYDMTAIITNGKDTKVLKAKLTIEKKQLTVKADDAEYKLGTPFDEMSFSYAVSGFVSGEDESFLTAVPVLESLTDLSLGTHDILFRDAAALNYSFEYVKGTLFIVDESFSGVTFNDKKLNYDGKGHTLIAEGADGIDVSYKNNGPFVDCGEYEITAMLSLGSTNKELTATLTIEKKELTVYALNATYYKGTQLSDMEFGYRINGLVNGETEDVFDVKPQMAAIEELKDGAKIAFGNAAAKNYSFSYVNNATLTIKEHYRFIDDGKYLIYGRYPQTAITDENLTEELKFAIENGLAKFDSDTGWFDYDGNTYAINAAKLNDASISCKNFADGTIIEEGKQYYFKVEDIVWKVLSDNSGEKFLITDKLLDAVRFNDSLNDVVVGDDVHYANAWEYSSIRQWLNAEFNTDIHYGYQESYINPNSDGDEVFFLSYSQVTDSAYGFEGGEQNSLSRVVGATDYAIAKGAFLPDNNYGYWWLSDACIAKDNVSNNATVAVADYKGYVSIGLNVSAQYFSVKNSACCIRPCIYFEEK